MIEHYNKLSKKKKINYWESNKLMSFKCTKKPQKDLKEYNFFQWFIIEHCNKLCWKFIYFECNKLK